MRRPMSRTAGLDQLDPPLVHRSAPRKKPQHEPTKMQRQLTKLKNAINRSKHSTPSLPVINLKEPAE